MDGRGVLDGSAWREFCDRMAALGETILEPGFPGTPGPAGTGPSAPEAARDRAEGVRHLANQLAGWLTFALGSTDGDDPRLFRHNDLVMRWGGPNVDQNARRATIKGSGVYRLAGTMNACEEFVVQVKGGEMHTGGAVVVSESTASAFGVKPGEDFEIILSAAPPAPGASAPARWLRIDDRVDTVHIRDYYFDWQPRQPAVFALQRLDEPDAPPFTAAPLTPDRVAGMLETAATIVENSIVFWRDYQENIRAGQPLNAFGPPESVPEGVQGLHYCHAFVRLGPGEALVTEVHPDDAAAWDVQLYSRAWYESLDFPHRPTSLNHRLAHRSAGGAVRAVIAATDPGVPNWLDTEGRTEVMSTHRWLTANRAPRVTSAVVPIAELSAYLPPGTPRVGSLERAAEVRRRAAHVAWRFRT
jgi:hypothetical protein